MNWKFLWELGIFDLPNLKIGSHFASAILKIGTLPFFVILISYPVSWNQPKLRPYLLFPVIDPTWYLKSQESNEQKCWIWMLSAIWMLSVPGFQRSLYCIRMKICGKSNFLAYFFQEICYKKLQSCVNYFEKICELSKYMKDRKISIFVYNLSTNAKKLFLQGRLNTRLSHKQFWDFPNMSLFPKILILTLYPLIS